MKKRLETTELLLLLLRFRLGRFHVIGIGRLLFGRLRLLLLPLLLG